MFKYTEPLASQNKQPKALADREGGGGRAAKAELVTGAEGVSRRPVRWIVLRSPSSKGGTR
jgi:hypothetical protein